MRPEYISLEPWLVNRQGVSVDLSRCLRAWSRSLGKECFFHPVLTQVQGSDKFPRLRIKGGIMSKMSVILKQDVEKLGKAGDLVQVSKGYARNYLMPKKMVIEADKHNLELVELHRKQARERADKHHQSLVALSGRLSEMTLSLTVKVGDADRLFGSITAQDIVDGLKARDILLDRKQIHLDRPLKELGESRVPVRLGEKVETALKVVLVASV